MADQTQESTAEPAKAGLPQFEFQWWPGEIVWFLVIFAVVFLVGVLSRAATVLFSIRHMTAQVVRLVSDLLTAMRVDFRHRRKRGTKSRKRLVRGRQNDDDAPAVIGGLAWA